jgi:hypothetical protein
MACYDACSIVYDGGVLCGNQCCEYEGHEEYHLCQDHVNDPENH